MYVYIYIKTYKEITVKDEANLIASSELSNVQFNALIRIYIYICSPTPSHFFVQHSIFF